MGCFHDHNIALLPGSQPVAVRSYWYPTSQKDELERQCAAILEQGLIRRSSSAFSSQAIQKRAYDQLRRAVAYAVGDPASMLQATKGKLKPRSYGPYRVAELISDVAVRLGFPPRARLHDVFHVGLLKKFISTPPDAPPPLPVIHHGAVIP